MDLRSRPAPAAWALALLAAIIVAACGVQPTVTGVATPSASPSPTASPTPTPSPIFVPSAASYFPRIDRFDFPTAPPSFIEALTRGFGSARNLFVSFTGRSIVHDGAQLPALVAVLVVTPELYARTDTFDNVTQALLQGLPGSVGRPMTVGGTLQVPATEIALANRAGYEVVYQQGFFCVQVIGQDPVLLKEIAEVLVAANSRRQP